MIRGHGEDQSYPECATALHLMGDSLRPEESPLTPTVLTRRHELLVQREGHETPSLPLHLPPTSTSPISPPNPISPGDMSFSCSGRASC